MQHQTHDKHTIVYHTYIHINHYRLLFLFFPFPELIIQRFMIYISNSLSGLATENNHPSCLWQVYTTSNIN